MASRSERSQELRAALQELDACVAKLCAERAARRLGASSPPSNGAAARGRAAVLFRAPLTARFAVPRDVPRGSATARRLRAPRLLLRPLRALLAWWRR